MNSCRYSAIVFDLGNVLILFDYNIALNKLNKIENNIGNRFIEFYNTNYHLHRNFEKGILSESDFITKMLEAVDNKIDAETFCRLFSDIFTINKDVASLLPILKKNYKLFLLSNTNSIHQKYGWQKYEFLEYFDKLILSHEVHSIKPEEKIYREVEKASGIQSAEHFYIDDIEEYVNTAKKIGWDAIQFVGYEKLLSDFKVKDIIY